MSELEFELLKAIIPSVITAAVAMVALITSAISSRKTNQTSYKNNIENMRFTQKEKISDQIIEKAAVLFTKTDPNYLNTLINEITPVSITEQDYIAIQNRLLGLTDEIQTLSNTIKMLSFSLQDKETESLRNRLFEEMDMLHSEIHDMIMQLLKLYIALTPNGNINNIVVLSEKKKLEKAFSEKYSKMYVDAYIDVIDLITYIKQHSIPNPIYSETR